MTKVFSSVRLFVVAGIGMLGSGLLLTSCLKDNDDLGNNDDVSAGLMAFNLAPGQTAVGFKIGGNAITQFPLAYNSYTSVYLPIFPGTRTVDAVSFNSGNTLATAPGNFETGKFYSVFLVGTDSTLENVIVRDNFDSLGSTGKAYIRYINAIADPSSPIVTITAGGKNVANSAAAYKSVSQFVAVDAGSATITLSNGGTINVNRSITLESRKVYTVLLIGKAGGTGDHAVQIKYIANGQVDENAGRMSSGAANRTVN